MLFPAALIACAVVLRPLPPCQISHLSRGAAPPCRRHAAVAACDAAESDWGALDSWLSEGSHTGESDAPTKPRHAIRDAVSAGHIHDHFYSKTASDWLALGASDPLQRSLTEWGYAHPTFAQAAAYPILAAADEDALFASAPGTGKCLAYLVPAIDRLRRIEAVEGQTQAGEVRCVVLVPSSELAQQVLETARQLSNYTIRSTIVTGEHSWSTQKERLSKGVDLVVATSGRLLAHLNPRDEMEPSCTLNSLGMLVVEEADALYAETRDSAPRNNWRLLLSEHIPKTSAVSLFCNTLPEGVESTIRSDLSPRGRTLHVWRGRGLHTTRPGIEATLVEVHRDVTDPFEARLEELLPRLSGARRTLVVANTVGTSSRLHRALDAWASEREGRIRPRVLMINESRPAEERERALRDFIAADGAADDPTLVRGGPASVLVATARALRGLNFGAEPTAVVEPPDHVACFDFPPDGQQYVKRLGFATRGDGPPGRVTLLALERQLPFARRMLAYDAEGTAIGVEPHTPVHSI